VIEVVPPGRQLPAFVIQPRNGRVVLTRYRQELLAVSCQDEIGSFDILPAALLTICPLPGATLAAIFDEIL
jgi:hypothetical protein